MSDKTPVEGLVDLNALIADATVDQDGVVELTLEGHWGVGMVLYEEELEQTQVAFKPIRTTPMDDVATAGEGATTDDTAAPG